MIIKLKTLNLENFKGIKKFTLAPRDKCQIRGANATGKTTLMDAFLWLLFGKDSQGKADFAIKTLKDGKEIPNLEHTVEVVFDIDGQIITLKKVLKEKYTKKRGSSRADFTGHTTDFYIDGVPVQKKEWDQRISNIIDEETFKLLTSPAYFNSIHWEKRRALLLEVCGDISDSDVIISDKVLAVLPEILGNKSIDAHRKVIKATQAEINQRLTEIPSRIDELDKSLADVSVYDIKAITAEITTLDKEIQDLKDDTKASLLRKQKADLQAELSEFEAGKHKADTNAEKEIDDKIVALEKEWRANQSLITDAQDQIKRKEQKIRDNKDRMGHLRDEYSRIATTKADVQNTCPTCGQAIPEDQVQEAIKKHNKRQATQLADINTSGKLLKKENEELEKEIEKLTAQGLKGEEKEKDFESQIGILKFKPTNTEINMDAILKVNTELQEIEKQIADNLPTYSLEAKRSALQAQIAKVEATGKTKKRITELGAEEKKLAAEYEELERQISLLEKFTVAKVGLLEGQINSKFELARFKLFETQINGVISETCVTLYDGVPYGYGLNSGAEINVGLDIVKTLSEHYGVKAPVFIDHSESVTDILDPGTQTIKLKVDEQCQELTVNNEN